MDSFVSGAIIGGGMAMVVLLAMAIFKKPVSCGACGTELPKFRKPANFKQAMWGGHTCGTCGAELDGRGRVKSG